MSIYEISIPVLVTGLTNLLKVIEKGERFAKQKNIAPKKFIEGRLASDMYNLKEQVGYAYFIALEAAGNLSGKKIPDFSYDETTFTELKTSLKRTIAFLKTIKPKDLKSADKKKFVSHLLPNKKLQAQKYVLEAILPNFFFHCTASYGILRHLRVPLTKEDYIGGL